MNAYFIAAGVFLFLAFLVHIMAGDKDYRELDPRKNRILSENARPDKQFGHWLMGRGTFQMVSVDLLLTSVFIFLIGIRVIQYNFYLTLFIALLYAGYLIFWLLTLAVSKARGKNYINQGQWILFLIALVLIAAGIQSAS